MAYNPTFNANYPLSTYTFYLSGPNMIPKPACPTNQQVGKTIDTLTIKVLLTISLTHVKAEKYLFCPDPNCPTVYYSANGQYLFTESDLRERVYQKHPDDDQNLICYCFQHTIGSIRDEITQTGSTTVVEQITTGIQAGQCACDLRNPQGDCCLGNVHKLVRRIMQENRPQHTED